MVEVEIGEGKLKDVEEMLKRKGFQIEGEENDIGGKRREMILGKIYNKKF